MKHFTRLSTVVFALLIFSFACTPKHSEQKIQSNNDHLLNAVLYHQTSAEYKALCYQAFTLGKSMLNNDLADKSVTKQRVIIVDIDETMLDNSPYEAKCIIDNINYPELWDEWVELAKAKAVPGALDFLNYVDSMGVGIMYVTNRKEHLMEPTMKNLQAIGFPGVEEGNLFMRTDKSSKEQRRQKILSEYHISLLVGDNIHDFTNAFEGKTLTEHSAIVSSMKSEFGKRFLVLPNPMYGSWDGALFKSYERITDQEKYKIRLKHLYSF